MDLAWLKKWRPALELRPGRRRAFESLGACDHVTADLCTFARNEYELRMALERNPFTSVVITTRDLAPRKAGAQSLVICDTPDRVFYELHEHLARHTSFYGERGPSRIHPTAVVHPRAHVDEAGVRLGPGVVVDAGAVILAGSTLEKGVRIGPNAVIGHEETQVFRFGTKTCHVTHMGGVRIGSGSRIGALSRVCASMFNRPTILGRDVVLGGQVMIAHQCHVGNGAWVLAGALILGTVEIGARAWVGCGAVVSNSVSVGPRARVSAGSFVTRDVPARSTVTGYFAVEHRRFLDDLKQRFPAGRGPRGGNGPR